MFQRHIMHKLKIIGLQVETIKNARSKEDALTAVPTGISRTFALGQLQQRQAPVRQSKATRNPLKYANPVVMQGKIESRGRLHNANPHPLPTGMVYGVV